MNPRRSRAAAAATAAVVLLAGCSALSGKDSSDTSFSARPSQPTASATDAPVRRAAFSSPATVAAVERDTRRDLGAVFSLDYHHLAAGKKAALAASTGDYADTVRTQYTAQARSALRSAGQTQVPQVEEVGVASLADRDRKAGVFASVTVNVTTKGQTPTTRTVHVNLTLERLGTQWRISTLKYAGFPSGPLPGNRDLIDAANGARAAIARLYTFSRGKAFEPVFKAALELQSGKLRLQSQLKEQSTRTAIDKLSYDQTASATGAAVTSIDNEHRPTFLVYVKSTHVISRSQKVGPYPVVVKAQVVEDDGHWLLSAAEQLQ